MATIREFTERFQAFDIEKVLVEVLVDKKAHVIDKNLNQLKEGKDANNEEMKTYKPYTISQMDITSPMTNSDIGKQYAQFKNELNANAGYGNPDLKLTGAYWSSFVLNATQGTEYEISATDSKASWLESHYSANKIYGMTGKSTAEFVNEIFETALTAKVKDILQL